MHPDVARLIELQNADVRLEDVRARWAAIPSRLKELDTRLAAARAGLGNAKATLTTSLKERKTYEMDVEQWNEKVRKYKDQLYSVKTNEAYKALQHEIQMGEEQIAKAEDKLLERMVAGEGYDQQVKTAEKSLAEVEAEVRRERATLEAERAAAEKELAEREAERRQAAAGIPEELLDHYHRIARKHDGVALAEVRDETCTMCRVRVRPHVFQELRNPASPEIFHCESCTRILYYLETKAAPTPAGDTAKEMAPTTEP